MTESAPTPRVAEPWERQSYDTDESWACFQLYRDLPPQARGLTLSLDGRRVDPVKLSRWIHGPLPGAPHGHFWSQRVAEYDRHLDRIRVEAIEKAQQDDAAQIMAEVKALTAMGRDILLREMEKLRSTVMSTPLEKVKVDQLIRLMDGIFKIDRLVRGESTANVDLGPDLSHLSDEQMSELGKLLGRD